MSSAQSGRHFSIPVVTTPRCLVAHGDGLVPRGDHDGDEAGSDVVASAVGWDIDEHDELWSFDHERSRHDRLLSIRVKPSPRNPIKVFMTQSGVPKLSNMMSAT